MRASGALSRRLVLGLEGRRLRHEPLWKCGNTRLKVRVYVARNIHSRIGERESEPPRM